MDLGKWQQKAPEFLAKHQYGKVPVWEQRDGLVLYESRAIMRHVAAGSSLVPTDPHARARMEQWISVERSPFSVSSVKSSAADHPARRRSRIRPAAAVCGMRHRRWRPCRAALASARIVSTEAGRVAYSSDPLPGLVHSAAQGSQPVSTTRRRYSYLTPELLPIYFERVLNFRYIGAHHVPNEALLAARRGAEWRQHQTHPRV